MFQLTTTLRTVSRTSMVRPVVARYTPRPRFFSMQSRLRLKEDGDRSPEQLEKAKQDQLKKQKEGKGEWHESLASAGEANIAADKENVKDHDSHMGDLQAETAKEAEKDHPHGKA